MSGIIGVSPNQKSGVIGNFPKKGVVQVVSNYSPTWQRAWSSVAENWVSDDDGSVTISNPQAGNVIVLWATFVLLPASSQVLWYDFKRVNADGTVMNVSGETAGAGRLGPSFNERISQTWTVRDTGFKPNSDNTYYYSIQPSTDSTVYVGHNDVAGGIIAMEVQG